MTVLRHTWFMTVRQAGLAAFKAARGETKIDQKHAKRSPTQILKERAKDDGQGLLGFLKTVDKKWTVTFDENDDKSRFIGLTDPAVNPDHDQNRRDRQNRIATIFVGARVKPNHAEPTGMTHVNILRTIEAMYGLPKSGAQQTNALRAGISDDTTAANVFVPVQ